MNTTIIHISDIHIKNDSELLKERFQKLQTAIENRCSGKNVLILVTGDISQSGKKSQYEVAKSSFMTLKEKLSSRGASVRFLFVPGNHDCDHDHPSAKTRSILVDTVAPTLNRKEAPEDLVAMLTAVQENFTDFCAHFDQNFSLKSLSNVYEVSDEVTVVALNTAWASKIDEPMGRPFPLSAIPGSDVGVGKFTFTIFHHPNSWIDRTIAHEFMQKIRVYSDFVLSGHEHNSSSYSAVYTTGETQFYFEANEFYNDGSLHGGFRLIEPDNNLFKVIDFSWDEEIKSYRASESPLLPIPTNSASNELGITINSEFQRFLADPGSSLKHSATKRLELRDFFVFPRLSHQLVFTASNAPLKIVQQSEETIKLLFEKQLTLVTGDDKSGKTSLIKVIFEDLFRKGYAPIYINGTDITHANSPYLRNLINKQISEQYIVRTHEEVLQHGSSKLVLLMDGIDRCDLAPRQLGEAMNFFRKMFGAILISADSTAEFGLVADPRFGQSMDDINRLELLPMSNNHRKQLVAKWLGLGNTIDLDSNSLGSHQLELYLTSLMSEYGIPNYPLFVLTYLQYVDAEKSFDIKISSNAKLLETLVDLGLNTVETPVATTATKIAYLADFAFTLFNKKQHLLTKEEVETFHKNYCDRIDISLPSTAIWKELFKSKIVYSDDEGRVGFRYSYFRTYFISQFIKFNLAKPEIKSLLETLVKDIHLSEHASILTTLSLYSSEEWVINDLVDQLESLLTWVEPISYFKLAETIKEVVKDENFDLRLISPSKVEERVHPNPQSQESKAGEAVELANEITHALRLIKVIGQLLRNSMNTMEGERKRAVVDAVLRGASRIVAVQNNALSQDKGEVLSFIYQKLKQNEPELAEADAKAETVKKLIQLLFSSAVGIIDTVSRSIGDEFLDRTYSRIESDGKSAKFDLMLLSIKLDWYRSFPETAVLSTFEGSKSIRFAEMVVRFLTYRSLAFRGSDLPFRTVQSICSSMNLDYNNLQLKQLSAIPRPRIQ